jgi:hypothetical protein
MRHRTARPAEHASAEASARELGWTVELTPWLAHGSTLGVDQFAHSSENRQSLLVAVHGFRLTAPPSALNSSPAF